jgi:hypothetical protein
MSVLAAVLVLASHRNLFQFVEPPPKKKTAVVVKKVTAVVVPPVVVTIPPPRRADEPPRFPYRCIGRFGPEADSFAVLDTGDTVINVKAGDVVDGKWRVIGVGYESMTVVIDGAQQRVPIAP